MRKIYSIGIALTFSFALIGCRISDNTAINSDKANVKKEQTTKQQQTTNEDSKIIYDNREYGFTFSLPSSWNGYKILKNSWEGTKFENQKTESGPFLLIRHPKWTEKNSRQDIPVMIFTLSQWNSLQEGEFSISAAGVSPIKLGQNNKYVFLIPPRYNFAYKEGFREVENILKSEPLQPNNQYQSLTEPKSNK